MADIDTIRALIQDTPLYAKEKITVDGVQTSLQVYFFPVVGGTVTVTGTSVPLFTLDQDNGVITFASAPATQELTIEYKHVSLLDSAIQIFLDIEEDLKLSAAQALDAIASQQALILKKIKLLDLETDGPAVAKSLRDHAKVLREQVLGPDGDEASFDIIEMCYDSASTAEKIVKDWWRGGL